MENKYENAKHKLLSHPPTKDIGGVPTHQTGFHKDEFGGSHPPTEGEMKDFLLDPEVKQNEGRH